jgi:hypothetical protein
MTKIFCKEKYKVIIIMRILLFQSIIPTRCSFKYWTFIRTVEIDIYIYIYHVLFFYKIKHLFS